jgi:hypothetical protein
MKSDLMVEKPATAAGSFRSPAFFYCGLVLIFFAIVWMARVNAWTFPLPNDDDAVFFLPAWYLTVHHTLSSPLMNAPNGVFWMPHGYYIWQALFLRIFGADIAVSRAVAQLSTATGAVLLVVAYARIGRSRAFALLCGALLVSPGVVFCANTVRMESLTILIFAIGLLLHSYGLRVAAAAMFFLPCVVHPEILMGAIFYAAGLLAMVITLHFLGNGAAAKEGSAQQRKRRSSAFLVTVLVLILVATAISVEGIYTLHHLDTFHRDMAYQVTRKLGRSPIQSMQTARGLLLILEVAFTIAVLWRVRRLPVGARSFLFQVLPACLVALGISTYATLGREVPYNVYSYAVIPATFSCLAYRFLTSSLPENEPAAL